MPANKKREVSKLMKHKCSIAEFSEVYPEPSRITKIEHFVKIVNSFERLTSFAENSFVDV